MRSTTTGSWSDARHGLSPFEATKLRREAETLEAEAPDTVRFTRAIKDAVPHEERESVLEAVLQCHKLVVDRDDPETQSGENDKYYDCFH